VFTKQGNPRNQHVGIHYHPIKKSAAIAARDTKGKKRRRLREEVGATQIRIAKLAGIPRMRLSLAETGDVELTPDETAAIRRAISTFAAANAAKFNKLAQSVANV
jgi:DNA-binding XRE family transcriptional regulator